MSLNICAAESAHLCGKLASFRCWGCWQEQQQQLLCGFVYVLPSNLIHWLTMDFTSHAPPAQGMVTHFLHSSDRFSLVFILGGKAIAVSLFQNHW